MSGFATPRLRPPTFYFAKPTVFVAWLHHLKRKTGRRYAEHRPRRRDSITQTDEEKRMIGVELWRYGITDHGRLREGAQVRVRVQRKRFGQMGHTKDPAPVKA